MPFMLFIQQFHHPVLDKFFWLITMMGGDYFFMAAIALIFLCVNKELGYRLGFSYLTNGLLNVSLKEVFRVPRPIGLPGVRSIHLETTGGRYSFPSGHSQCTASFWTSLMLHVRKKWLYILGIVMMLAVGISRIYLGVHTPSDVAAGILIGAGWVFAANFIFDRVKGKPLFFLFIVIPVLIGMLIFRTPVYFKACGAMIGFILGFIIESRYIRFVNEDVPRRQAAKFAVGAGGLFAIKLLLKATAQPGLCMGLVEYFLMAIWLTAVAPSIFMAGR